jgi:hypothetical protein
MSILVCIVVLRANAHIHILEARGVCDTPLSEIPINTSTQHPYPGGGWGGHTVIITITSPRKPGMNCDRIRQPSRFALKWIFF